MTDQRNHKLMVKKKNEICFHSCILINCEFVPTWNLFFSSSLWFYIKSRYSIARRCQHENYLFVLLQINEIKQNEQRAMKKKNHTEKSWVREDTLRLHQRFALFVRILVHFTVHAILLRIVVRQKCAYEKIRVGCRLGSILSVSLASFFFCVIAERT